MQGRKAGRDIPLRTLLVKPQLELLESQPVTNKRNERLRRKADPISRSNEEAL
jgi:hypothetical protein